MQNKLTPKEKIKVGINSIVILAMIVISLDVWLNPKGFYDILVQGIPAMALGIVIITLVGKAYQKYKEIRN